MKFTLDSSTIIDYLKNKAYITDFLESLEDRSRLLLPVIAKAEVKYVNEEIGSFENLETIKLEDRDIHESMKILQFLENRGERINMIDILIAANTIKRNSILITADKDFQKLEEYENFSYKTVTPD
jgi:predicted nucleic acid-binding protein